MKKVFFLLLLSLLSSAAIANPTCIGEISRVSLSYSGGVHGTVKSDSGVNLRDVMFCNANSSSGRFTGDSCDALLSILLSASAMNQTITLWFYQDEFTSCDQSWASLANMGFYHMRVQD